MLETLQRTPILTAIALLGCLTGFNHSATALEDGDPTPNNAATGERPNQKVVDLLKRVQLTTGNTSAQSVVSGSWLMLTDGLKCRPPVSATAPGRIRFGAAYKDDYDLCMTFTPLAGRGGVGLILAHQGREFAWMMGAGDGSAFSFERSTRAGTLAADLSPLLNGHRYRVEVRVRGDRVTARIDNQPEFEYLTDYSDLSLNKEMSVGAGQLGMLTAREILVHSAEMKCLTPAKPGRPKTRERAGDQGQASRDQAGAGQVLPAKRVFRGQQIKTFTPDRIRRMGCTLVVVKRTADRVILRQDGERRYCAEWTFAVKGNRLILIDFRPLGGTHRAMDQVQAVGTVNGKTLRIDWSWRFTGPRRANHLESGYILADLDE